MRAIVLAIILLSMSHATFAEITQAKVTGGVVSGVAEGELMIFKGIPFAAPPVGELRWKAPAPVQSWSGVKKADAFADACMQPANSMGNTAPVNEDCLYLNVWTPAKSANEKIPVIVWVHGGGFVGGSTSIPMYDGSGFANKGVVLVSLAHRLGPYGFLAHPELSKESGKGSGAYGIQDLIVGLEWVQNNIAEFGGDPNSVTIFGHSAGSAAASFLAASPLTKGMFHRVIAMSGSSFTPLQTDISNGFGLGIPALKLAEENGEELFAKLGVSDVAAARKVSAEKIQNALSEGGPGGMRFWPVADGYVLSHDMYTLYQQKKFNDTPLLLGHTSDEMIAFGSGPGVTPADFEKRVNSRFGALAKKVLNAYPHATDADAVRATRHLGNDITFVWNTWTWARLQSQQGKGKVYGYYFDHHAPEAEGSGHGSDVPYAFQTLRRAPSEKDLEVSDILSSYWVNFAKTGNPNGKGLPEWSAFSNKNQTVMVFDASPSSGPLPNQEKLTVFDEYFGSMRAE